MPIRVNLKEIFPSDPQEITVNKVNFNFNKLLELGIGTPGPIGLTGPVGPAGPIGLTGPQGDRGATWWVDSGDPNTLTFTGLIDGDLYLDQSSMAFQVYQYDDLTSTWNPVVSIAAVVNAYLSSLSTIPFETVPTTQLPGVTTVNKFILFDERAAGSDLVRGTNNTSLNNILFLNNFEEDSTIDTALISQLGQDQYNSLLGIYPDHSDATLSSNAEIGRYHIELGSLYTPDNAVTKYYSNIKHNLKVKFYKRDLTTVGAQLPSTNDWINTARFSLSVTENQTVADIDQNSEFEFIFPKWNNEGMSPIQEQVTIRLSSADAAVEQGSAFTHIVADGIHISTTSSSINATFGLALDYSSLDSRLNGKNHLMLDTNSGIDGVILLNNDSYVNGELLVTNRIGVGTSSPNTTSRQHNYLDGSYSTDRIMTYNQITNLDLVGVLFPTTRRSLTVNLNSIQNVDGGVGLVDPNIIVSRSNILGTNSIQDFTGNLLSISGTNSISTFKGDDVLITGTLNVGNFTGFNLDLTGATLITHSGNTNFNGVQIKLDNSSNFIGSSIGDIFGTRVDLSPDMDSGTGGALRGHQINLLDYRPNATTQVYGTRTNIRQEVSLPQGIIVGSLLDLSINNDGSSSNTMIGQEIKLNTSGFSLPPTSYGSYIQMGTNILGGGVAYGIYIKDATDNHLEGDTRIKGSLSVNSNDSYTQYIKNVWHGWVHLGFNTTNLALDSYYIDEQLPTGFSVNHEPPSSVTRIRIILDHPSISNRRIVQVTMRYIGGGGIQESVAVIPTVDIISPTQTGIYFDDQAGSWGNNTRLGFNFNIVELP
jgi:hypothetical protein